MNFDNLEEWLERRLAQGSDGEAAAGGKTLEELRTYVAERTVTSGSLNPAASDLGKVLRYVRVERGWSQREIANRADVDEADVVKIETEPRFDPSPRTLVNLANACGFSPKKFQRLAHHVRSRTKEPIFGLSLQFAAQSQNVGSLTTEELDMVRSLIAALADKDDPR